MLEYPVLAAAVGMLNAMAGGKSFISLPALLFYSVPPTAANAASAASLLPGYMGSLVGFRRNLAPPVALGVWGVAGTALAGGVSGVVMTTLMFWRAGAL